MDNDCVSCGEIDEELIDVDGIGGFARVVSMMARQITQRQKGIVYDNILQHMEKRHAARLRGGCNLRHLLQKNIRLRLPRRMRGVRRM